MATKIHPTAILEKGVELDDGVMVDAFALLGAQVTIGAGTTVGHHASIVGNTLIGCDCEIFPYAFIGARSQDLKFKGGNPGVTVGDRNLLREYTTIHAATADGAFTTLGNNGLLCAYSHIAHDCQVGDHLVMSSHAALGGHAMVADHVNIGWNAGVHQFCRVGSYAMVAACAKLVQDLLPFMICDGNPAEVRTINKVGLQRAGFTEKDLMLTRQAYRYFYREGLNRKQALEKLRAHERPASPIIGAIIEFAEQSERGFV